MFNNSDLEQITRRGSSLERIQEQIRYFEEGFPFLQLSKPATIGDGVIRIGKEEALAKAASFDKMVANGRISLLKFVPASGAASRMFKSLFAFLDKEEADKSVNEFFDRLTDFAFYRNLQRALQADGYDISAAERQLIAEYFLTDKGLGYGLLPKGLLEFHKYEGRSRTPLEEHLVEAVKYASAGGTALLHFTVSPEHRDKFEKLVVERLPLYESQYGVKFYVSFSEQHPATDTIAVNPDNTPFREKDGSLLFRPAGHGSLLANLGELDADVIFIKNVDNVVPDHRKEDTILYKKVLACLLLEYQQRLFDYLRKLKAGASPELLAEVDDFLQKELCVRPPQGFDDWEEDRKVAYLIGKLDRPLRVCGMVKNEGEPGGGPFWVANRDGSASLQVVESAQVDLKEEGQKEIWSQATHFNPVDLVVAVRNHEGELFDLPAYRDPQTGFISSKSKDGRELKAQELPGLWNGSMADWNTLFVEVPLTTFNPVKTVNDLLREQHQ